MPSKDTTIIDLSLRPYETLVTSLKALSDKDANFKVKFACSFGMISSINDMLSKQTLDNLDHLNSDKIKEILERVSMIINFAIAQANKSLGGDLEAQNLPTLLTRENLTEVLASNTMINRLFMSMLDEIVSKFIAKYIAAYISTPKYTDNPNVYIELDGEKENLLFQIARYERTGDIYVENQAKLVENGASVEELKLQKYNEIVSRFKEVDIAGSQNRSRAKLVIGAKSYKMINMALIQPDNSRQADAYCLELNTPSLYEERLHKKIKHLGLANEA